MTPSPAGKPGMHSPSKDLIRTRLEDANQRIRNMDVCYKQLEKRKNEINGQKQNLEVLVDELKEKLTKMRELFKEAKGLSRRYCKQRDYYYDRLEQLKHFHWENGIQGPDWEGGEGLYFDWNDEASSDSDWNG